MRALSVFFVLACVAGLTVCAQEPAETVRVRIVDFGQLNSRWNEDVGFGQGSDGGIEKPYEIIDEVDLDGNPDTDDWIETWAFSLQKLMNPHVSWWDDSWVSSRFYGGIAYYYINRPDKDKGITEWYNNSAESDEAMQPASDFALHMANNIIGSPFRGYAVWLWKKEDFLHGASNRAARVRLDETSVMALYRQRHWNGYDGVRFAVQNGSQFYVSEVLPDRWRTANGGSGFFDRQMACPADLTWAEWTPKEGDLHIEFDPATPFKKVDFDDVQAVGWYLFKDNPKEVQTGFKFESFEVYATVDRPVIRSEVLDLADVTSSSIPPFMMNRTELSFQQWKTVFRWSESIGQWALDIPGMIYEKNGDMGSMDFTASHGLDRTHSHAEPVTDITFYDALVWCNALSEYEEREYVYYTDPEYTKPFRDVIKGPWLKDPAVSERPVIYVKWSADGYRLPTPVEWAVAAGSGGTSDIPVSPDGTRPVEALPANERGMKGIEGNVWELVWTFGDRLDPDPGQITALGGSFAGAEHPLEVSASPYGDRPFYGSATVGFRPVRRAAGLPAPPAGSAASTVPAWVIRQTDRAAVREPEPLDLPLVTVPGGLYSGKVKMSSFTLGATEVTFRQWKQVYDWALANGFTFDRDGDMGSMSFRLVQHEHHPDEPVTGITYFDALAWCNALSLMRERTPVFYADEERTQIYRHAWRYRPVQLRNIDYEDGPFTPQDVYGWQNVPGRKVWMDWSADGFRPPTRAEWGYAYASGSDDVFPWGSSFDGADNMCWHYGNAGLKTHRVAQLQPNSYGLYDMAGNVSEMVVDSAGKGARRMDDQTINPIEYYTPYDYSAKWRIMFLKSAFVYDVEPFFHSPPVFGGAWAGGTPGWYWPDQGFRVTSSQAYPRDGYAPGYVRTDATPLDIKGKSFDPLQGQTHRANLYRNGLFQTDGLLSLNGLKWKFKTGGPVRSSPVVTDGFVYIGSGDGRVYALDAETGKERWSFKTEGPVLSSACVAGGIVYIGSDDGNLYALDAQSGAKVWDVMVGAGDGRTGVIQSTPAVLYGIVFIGGNAPDEGFETAHGRTRKSWGYDAKTGERVWVQKHGYSPQGLTSMAASDGRLVCPSMLGLQIYDLQTGMITGGGSLYSSGHIRHATPSINGDRIFIPNSLEACVYEYTLDGQKQWFGWCYADPKTRSLKRAGREMFGSLTMVNETIYAPVNNGKLYTFATQAAGSAWDRPVKGWTLDVGAPLKSSLSEAGGLLYFGADDGKIRAIKAVPVDASAPETEWSFQTGGPVISTPWPGDNALYAGSDDGYVYCLH